MCSSESKMSGTSRSKRKVRAASSRYTDDYYFRYRATSTRHEPGRDGTTVMSGYHRREREHSVSVSGRFPNIMRLRLHEGQPPAAARAVRLAAKNAPAGQRQIRAISVRSFRAGHGNDYPLRQPPPAAPAKTASGGSKSTLLVALASFGLIVSRRCFRRLGLDIVRLRQLPPRHALQHTVGMLNRVHMP